MSKSSLVPLSGFIGMGDKQLYFTQIGKGFPTIFLLGWSSNLDNFPYEQAFSYSKDSLNDNQIVFLHLSNFYKSTLSKVPLTLDDYSHELDEVVGLLGYDCFNIIGHSAGGRIGLHYTAKNSTKVNKLVLMSSAGLKHKDANNAMLSRAGHYFSQLNPINSDQKSILKLTFSNLYNTDLSAELSFIDIPTLIIWGENDKVINVSRAYFFNQNLKNSHIKIFPDTGHMTTHEPEIIYQIFKFLHDPAYQS